MLDKIEDRSVRRLTTRLLSLSCYWIRNTHCCAVNELLQLRQNRSQMRHRELVQVENEYFFFERVQLWQSDVDGHEVNHDVVWEFKVIDFWISQTTQRNSTAFVGEFRQRNEKSKTNVRVCIYTKEDRIQTHWPLRSIILRSQYKTQSVTRIVYGVHTELNSFVNILILNCEQNELFSWWIMFFFMCTQTTYYVWYINKITN